MLIIGSNEPLAVLHIFIWGYPGGTFSGGAGLKAEIFYMSQMLVLNGVVIARMLYLTAS
jgi:hypothetical protein